MNTRPSMLQLRIWRDWILAWIVVILGMFATYTINSLGGYLVGVACGVLLSLAGRSMNREVDRHVKELETWEREHCD